MKTILVLAEALAKTSIAKCISRLDIQYNSLLDMYIGHVYLSNNIQYTVFEDGTITKE